MNNDLIVHKALVNLFQTTQLKGNWEENRASPLDGSIRLCVGDQTLLFNVAIRNDLRIHSLPQLFELNKDHSPLLVVVPRLFPRVKEQLQAHQVSYLEANGNLYIKTPDKWFWIETNEPLKIETNIKNRAFTKTGLQVLFELLRHPILINAPYRQIAEQTGTSVGNITHIVNGLKQDDFLLQVAKKEYSFQQTAELLSRWITAYEQTLLPTLYIGRFRFLDKEGFANWKKLRLNTPKTQWGGEAAGDLLTNYLKPAELTLYTEEGRAELMKNYRLFPDDSGGVLVYRKFWQRESEQASIVPALLVYADLIRTNDRRCTETAQKIYDEYLQTKLP